MVPGPPKWGLERSAYRPSKVGVGKVGMRGPVPVTGRVTLEILQGVLAPVAPREIDQDSPAYAPFGVVAPSPRIVGRSFRATDASRAGEGEIPEEGGRSRAGCKDRSVAERYGRYLRCPA